jgi:acyl-coenzyme A thioesterase PaaI-like protein
MTSVADGLPGTAPEPDPAEVAARDRAGRAVRDLGHALVGRHADPAAILAVAATVEALVAELERGAGRRREPLTFGYQWKDAVPRDRDAMTTYADRPISGSSSPWGVDMEVRREAHEAVGRLTLRAAHEGAPGRSHGGVVAAVFDDLMGFVLQIEHQSAFTGELTVRYLQPVPLDVPLEFRARLRERSGRKLLIDAEATDGRALLARASGVFIAASFDPPAT